jgi:hypothetical protein
MTVATNNTHIPSRPHPDGPHTHDLDQTALNPTPFSTEFSGPFASKKKPSSSTSAAHPSSTNERAPLLPRTRQDVDVTSRRGGSGGSEKGWRRWIMLVLLLLLAGGTVWGVYGKHCPSLLSDSSNRSELMLFVFLPASLIRGRKG